MRELSNQLVQQNTNLVDSAAKSRADVDGMTETVQNNSQKLSTALDSAAAKAASASKTFIEQARLLAQASVDADEQAKKLSEKEQTGRRDLFLKTARFIIEDLNSTAIDLTRALYSEVSEADWKRYTKGDRGVFTRSLMRGRHAAMISRIGHKMKEDTEMRDYVMRYVDQFDRLLKESEDSDPENLLHATFMTADVGKLYLMLCRAVGREN